MTATQPSVTGLYVGSSGFSYPEWRGSFYPADARPPDFLRLYAERLGSVELNNPFHQLPAEGTFFRWAGEVPEGFRFTVKMSRGITHFGRLDRIPDFCSRVRALGDKLGPVLVQFPPNRPHDEGFLRLFLDFLDPELEYAFEFRHESWDVGDVLAERGVALVGSLEGATGFRYLRLREPPYDDTELAAWAARLRPLLADGLDVYCYFNRGDAEDHSPGGEPTAVTALRLRALLG